MKTNINNIKTLKESGLKLNTILGFSSKQIEQLSKKIRESSEDTQKLSDELEKKANIEKEIEMMTQESDDVVDTDRVGNPEVEFRSDGDEDELFLDKEDKLEEKFVSKAQQRYFYSKANEGGKEGKKFKSMADEFSKDTDFDNLPEKAEELDEIIEGIMSTSHSSRYLTKAEFTQTVLETVSEFEEQMTEPAPTIAPSKPKTMPGQKPGRKSPYKPKHKPKPKAELPDELKFDMVFKKHNQDDAY